jgi:Zn-dependent protease
MSTDLIYIIAALVVAMVLHELAHGLIALWLGDTTAQKAGRLTLNPVLLPLCLAIGEIGTFGRVVFMFGWARPIPINAAALNIQGTHNPRRLMALVAIAGPACNLAQAFIGWLALSAGLTWAFLPPFIVINLLLGLFNLIPMPPMDGGRIAVGLLPLPLAKAWAQLEPYGISLVFLFIFVIPMVCRQFGIHFDPVHDVLNAALNVLGPM